MSQGPVVSRLSARAARALREREIRRFAELRPRGMGLVERARPSMPNGVPMAWMATLYDHPPIVVEAGSGGAFTDIDGNDYVDFNLADTSMFAGYGVEAVAARRRRARGRGIAVPAADRGRAGGRAELGAPLRAALLAVHALGDPGQHRGDSHRPRRHRPQRRADVRRQVPRPRRRAARRARRRRRRARRAAGSCPTRRATCASSSTTTSRRSSASWRAGDVACVLAEAAITNAGVIQPAHGFHAGLRRLASRAGALLVLDETHTLVAGPGRADRSLGPRARHARRSASRSRRASRWAPTA